MTLNEIIKLLRSYADVMEFMPPVSMIDVFSYEKKMGHKLPESYVNLLKQFNGGEIFIPGTEIYGVRPRERYYSLDDANMSEKRSALSIPDDYLIVGKLNFGDLICIDLNGSGEVIQWDHENDEEYLRWNSINNWLTEIIGDYQLVDGENADE